MHKLHGWNLMFLSGVAGQVSKAVCCLAEDHPAAQQACTSAIPAVLSFLPHPDASVRDQACQALTCLTCSCHQNQISAGQHGAVETLLHLLWTPCESQQQQQEVVLLLLALLVLAVQVGRWGCCTLTVLHANIPLHISDTSTASMHLCQQALLSSTACFRQPVFCFGLYFVSDPKVRLIRGVAE